MRSKTYIFAALLLLITLVAPASAGLFGPTTQTFKGRINFLQQTNFSMLTETGGLVRIMVTRDRRVPPEVQLGVVVEVVAILGTDQQWYLDKFNRIQLQPNQ